jgi:hypothetical protein
MSRYRNALRTGLVQQQAQAIVTEYLQSEGFIYTNDRGEMVWRKGVGALANPQFIKAEVASDGTVVVEAWTAAASLLPGVYGGELDPMQGAFGWGPKLALKPRVRELERRLGGESVAVPTAVAPPAAWYPDPTGRHEQRYWDGSRWTENVSDAGQAGVDGAGVA